MQLEVLHARRPRRDTPRAPRRAPGGPASPQMMHTGRARPSSSPMIVEHLRAVAGNARVVAQPFGPEDRVGAAVAEADHRGAGVRLRQLAKLGERIGEVGLARPDLFQARLRALAWCDRRRARAAPESCARRDPARRRCSPARRTRRRSRVDPRSRRAPPRRARPPEPFRVSRASPGSNRTRRLRSTRILMSFPGMSLLARDGPALTVTRSASIDLSKPRAPQFPKRRNAAPS